MSAAIVAVDAMSGDQGPKIVIPACLASLAEYPWLHLILVGHERLLRQLLSAHSVTEHARLQIVHASEVVGMAERPSHALRGKPDSSMRVAVDLVRQGRANACVSAGNTGALMAISRHLLRTLPGVQRPAIMALLPSLHGGCHVLDLGANVDCSAEQLYQFGLMGSAAVCALGVANPRVALLNLGGEPGKGNRQVRLASKLFEESSALNYVGYIEGDALFMGDADVVVCDGFVGNIMLKSSEGLARLIAERARAGFFRNGFSRLLGFLALPVLRRLKEDFQPSRYNGASLLGLQGIVVKSHGATGKLGFQSAIGRAIQEIGENLPALLSRSLKTNLAQTQVPLG